MGALCHFGPGITTFYFFNANFVRKEKQQACCQILMGIPFHSVYTVSRSITLESHA